MLGLSVAATAVAGLAVVAWLSRKRTGSHSPAPHPDDACGPYRRHMRAALVAAGQAGAVIRDAIGSKPIHTKLNKTDLVTKFDPLCEQLIIDSLKAAFASGVGVQEQHEFIGEEDNHSNYGSLSSLPT